MTETKDVENHFLRQTVEDKKIALAHESTHDVADVPSKILSAETHSKHRNALLNLAKLAASSSVCMPMSGGRKSITFYRVVIERGVEECQWLRRFRTSGFW